MFDFDPSWGEFFVGLIALLLALGGLFWAIGAFFFGLHNDRKELFKTTAKIKEDYTSKLAAMDALWAYKLGVLEASVTEANKAINSRVNKQAEQSIAMSESLHKHISEVAVSITMGNKNG